MSEAWWVRLLAEIQLRRQVLAIRVGKEQRRRAVLMQDKEKWPDDSHER